MTIRRIRADDAAGLRELRLRALTDAPEAFGTTHAESAARPAAFWQEAAAAGAAGDEQATFLLDDAGLLLGMVSAHRAEEAAGTVAVTSMWVDPAVRTRGVGRELLGAALNWGRGWGARRAVLSVTETNDAARRLYERAGFVPTGQSEPLRSNPALRIVEMARMLTPPRDEEMADG